MVKRNIYNVDNSRCMASATRTRSSTASATDMSVQPQNIAVSTTPMPDDVNGMDCGAGADSVWGIEGYPLAMVYAPLQNFSNIYTPEIGLARGTIFAELDLPIGTLSPRGANSGGLVRNG